MFLDELVAPIVQRHPLEDFTALRAIGQMPLQFKVRRVLQSAFDVVAQLLSRWVHVLDHARCLH